MTSAQSAAIQIALGVLATILTAYCAGRAHEWYRRGFERDIAYREGYHRASRTLFKLAVHDAGARAKVPAPTPGAVGTASPTLIEPTLTENKPASDRRRQTRRSRHRPEEGNSNS